MGKFETLIKKSGNRRTFLKTGIGGRRSDYGGRPIGRRVIRPRPGPG